MGKLVLGLASPHNPLIRSRPESMTEELKHTLFGAFERLRKGLAEASPDVLVILTTDHLTNFFYHNNPLFCLAVSDTCTGPAAKELPELHIPQSRLKVDTSFARGLLQYGIEQGIDFSISEEMILDHAFMVPLSFLTPQMDLPIVPLHIGSLLTPTPTAERCHTLGRRIEEFVRTQYSGKVAILVSGSFSGDVGGPKMGAADTALDMEFMGLIKAGEGDEIVRRATPATLERAGVANEILPWAAFLGALGPVPASFTEYVCGEGWTTAASLAMWNPDR